MQESKKPKKERFLPRPEWLLEKIREAEMDTDTIVKALIKSYATYRDPKDAEQIWRRIEPKLTQKALLNDHFAPNPRGSEVDGDIRIGKVKRSGADFGLDFDELGEHTLITGRAGAGKTTIIYLMMLQLLVRGVPFWAFDFKQDYRHTAKSILHGGPEVLVFNWESFRFNPLRSPAGVSPRIWMQAFANVFCQVYWLLSGSKSLILQHVEKLYQDYGVFSGSDVYPSMRDLLESLEMHKPGRTGGRREHDYLDSAKNRVIECLLSFRKMFDCDKGYPLEDLLTKNIVLELEGLLSENQAFLTTIILRYVFQYRISNNQRSSLKHVFLFDEAKNVYDGKREFTKELGPSEVARFTSTIREFGEGLVLADQMPTELGNSIKANVYSVICMSQSGIQNILEMSKSLGLTREQEEACRMLQSDKNKNVFEAIVKLNGKWLKPFRIHVTPFRVKKDLAEADLRSLMAPIFEKMDEQVTPRTEYKTILEAQHRTEEQREAETRRERREKAEQKESVEGNILIRILTNIRDHPFIEQKERIYMLNLGSSSSTTDKYFKELIARGFVQVHRIGLGKGQSTKVLYEITGKGAGFAHMNKVSIPGKGDFKHKFWQHKIQKFFQSLGYNAEVEKRYGIKSVDVGFEMNGKKTAVEVELSSDNLIENIQRDLEAGCEVIIIAAPNQRSVTSYEKKISFYNKEYLNKVEFRVLTDFL